jgi:hypothetical protein
MPPTISKVETEETATSMVASVLRQLDMMVTYDVSYRLSRNDFELGLIQPTRNKKPPFANLPFRLKFSISLMDSYI